MGQLLSKIIFLNLTGNIFAVDNFRCFFQILRIHLPPKLIAEVLEHSGSRVLELISPPAPQVNASQKLLTLEIGG